MIKGKWNQIYQSPAWVGGPSGVTEQHSVEITDAKCV